MLGYVAVYLNVYHIGCAAHVAQFLQKEPGILLVYLKRIGGIGRSRKPEIAVKHNVAVVVGEHYRDTGVGLDYAQKEIYVGAVGSAVAGIDNLLGGSGPYLHACPLLSREIFHERVGEIEEHRHHYYGGEQKGHGAVTSDVVDIHNS